MNFRNARAVARAPFQHVSCQMSAFLDPDGNHLAFAEAIDQGMVR
jgi:hypothetical protein